MPYHQLPAAFVANDFLCDFLLAQGLEKVSDELLAAGGYHYFRREHAAAPLRIEISQAGGTIEVYQLPEIAGSYTTLPAAALVLLLTTQPCAQQAGLFHRLVAALGDSPRPVGGRAPGTAGQLPPLASTRTTQEGAHP